MTFVTDLLSALVACVAVGSLVRLAQFASSKAVEKETVRQHAEAIGLYSAVTAAAFAVLGVVYWLTTIMFYKRPDVPELVPVPELKKPMVAFPDVPAPVALVPVEELRRMMIGEVTPRAPPPIKPVLPHKFR
jgi:hypothetical protein